MKVQLTGSLGMKYEYDANNRQTAAKLSDNTSLQTSVYDCAGQRVQTTAGSTTRTMVYDIFGQDIADYTGSTGGTLERENIYRGGLLTTYEAGSSSYKYVLQDVQGSTRAVMDNNGSSSVITFRHDYLPFGEEVWSGVGLRSSSQGYSTSPWANDTIRPRYALTERDDATGLDHTPWRKYESFSGRWTSPDRYHGSMSISQPQSFNRYSYTHNDPVNFVDPTGRDGDPVNDGIAGARAALQNSSCRGLFRGRDDPLKLLDMYADPGNGLLQVVTDVTPWGVAFEDQLTAAKTNASTGEIAINQNSWFVSGTITIHNLANDSYYARPVTSFRNVDTGLEGLSLTQARAILLIHEMLHVVGTIPRDGSNPTMSVSNNMLVRLFCITLPNMPLTTTTEVPQFSPLLRPVRGAGGGGSDPLDFFRWWDLRMEFERQQELSIWYYEHPVSINVH